jgi:mono/diheme cytochrome c family protein
MRQPRILLTLATGAILALSLAFASPATQGQQSDPARAQLAPPIACPEAGQVLYERSCLRCHGKDATGGSFSFGRNRTDGPPLRGIASHPEADWEEIIDFIEEGHGSMPAWRGITSRPNLRRILEYLDSLERPELYEHEMEARASARRRGKPTECDTEQEAEPAR